jgi:hypothetical protein
MRVPAKVLTHASQALPGECIATRVLKYPFKFPNSARLCVIPDEAVLYELETIFVGMPPAYYI